MDTSQVQSPLACHREDGNSSDIDIIASSPIQLNIDSQPTPSSQPMSLSSEEFRPEESYEIDEKSKLRKMKFYQMKELKQALEKFKTEALSLESDVLSANDIVHEVINFFANEDVFLQMGYVKTKNIKQFCRNRPLKDRRIIKMACLSDCPSESQIKSHMRIFKMSEESTLDLLERRISNDPLMSRSDRFQKRLSVATQLNLMDFIMKNSVFHPGRNKLKKIRVSKIQNLATRIFLR